MILILLIILVLCVVGLPNVGVVNYGYAPSGLLGTILIILLVWVLLFRGHP